MGVVGAVYASKNVTNVFSEPDAASAKTVESGPAADKGQGGTRPNSVWPKATRVSVVQPGSREIDLAKDISFSPDTDPTCKEPAPVVNLVKDVGYGLDQELRKNGEAVTDEEEEKIGEEAFREIKRSREFRGKLDTPAMAQVRAYIAEVAKPLLAQIERKGIKFDFHTIDDNEPNAFAIPGGHIFVYRGILEKPGRIENEAQLAGVLAHEMNHVDRRHTIAVFDYMKQLGGGDSEIEEAVISMARHPFTSKQEEEADKYAVKFLIGAEYSPKQFVTMWQAWGKLDKEKKGNNRLFDELEEILQTHPASGQRACAAMKVTMEQKDPEIDRYYVGTTNYKTKVARSAKQF